MPSRVLTDWDNSGNGAVSSDGRRAERRWEAIDGRKLRRTRS